MSKIYAVFLVIAAQLAMAALGLLIVVAVMDIAQLAAPTIIYGMNR